MGSLLMAAILSPWFYLWGRQLAAAAAGGELPELLEWLGEACGRSRFSRFFDRALLFSSLMLMPLLLRRIRKLRAAPDAHPVSNGPAIAWRSALAHMGMACMISAGVLFGLGMILDATGMYVSKPVSPTLGRIFSKVFIPAVAASLVEEWIFRGVLLGLWLRFSRPWPACLGTSLLFSFLHFLNPPGGALIADPSHPLAGFNLLGKILLHFGDPLFFVTDFASLAIAGMILAWARVRTGALWFSIGLHSGWIMAFKAFHQFYRQVPDHPLSPWGVGENLRSGLLPLMALLVTAWICKSVLTRFEASPTPVNRA